MRSKEEEIRSVLYLLLTLICLGVLLLTPTLLILIEERVIFGRWRG